jgi:oligoendopeptidase F
MYTADIKKLQRNFLPKDFTITDWHALEPYFKALVEREIADKADLEKWLKEIKHLKRHLISFACKYNLRCSPTAIC